MSLLEKFIVDGVAWEAYEGFGDDDILYQRRCQVCDGSGLLLAPARHCPECDQGFVVQREDPRPRYESETP